MLAFDESIADDEAMIENYCLIADDATISRYDNVKLLLNKKRYLETHT